MNEISDVMINNGNVRYSFLYNCRIDANNQNKMLEEHLWDLNHGIATKADLRQLIELETKLIEKR